MDALPNLSFTPAVGDMPFTPKQRSLLSLASELGRTRFAPRAAQWDETASFPFANYDDLRDAGLLKMCVPGSHGGLGADYATYMMVAAEIGRHCGTTALTWNMHICSTMWTGVLADGIAMSDVQRAEHLKRRELHFARIVNDGAIYAQPFSEGSAAAAGREPRQIRRASGKPATRQTRRSWPRTRSVPAPGSSLPPARRRHCRRRRRSPRPNARATSASMPAMFQLSEYSSLGWW